MNNGNNVGHDPVYMGQVHRSDNIHRSLTSNFREEKAGFRPLSDADARLQRQTSTSRLDSDLGHSKRPNLQTGLYAAEPPITGREKFAIGLLVLVAAVVRLWKIWSPTSVVYVSFGYFAPRRPR